MHPQCKGERHRQNFAERTHQCDPMCGEPICVVRQHLDPLPSPGHRARPSHRLAPAPRNSRCSPRPQAARADLRAGADRRAREHRLKRGTLAVCVASAGPGRCAWGRGQCLHSLGARGTDVGDTHHLLPVATMPPSEIPSRPDLIGPGPPESNSLDRSGAGSDSRPPALGGFPNGRATPRHPMDCPEPPRARAEAAPQARRAGSLRIECRAGAAQTGAEAQAGAQRVHPGWKAWQGTVRADFHRAQASRAFRKSIGLRNFEAFSTCRNPHTLRPCVFPRVHRMSTSSIGTHDLGHETRSKRFTKTSCRKAGRIRIHKADCTSSKGLRPGRLELEDFRIRELARPTPLAR